MVPSLLSSCRLPLYCAFLKSGMSTDVMLHRKRRLDGYRCFYSDSLPTCPNHAFPWFFMIKPWLSHGFPMVFLGIPTMPRICAKCILGSSRARPVRRGKDPKMMWKLVEITWFTICLKLFLDMYIYMYNCIYIWEDPCSLSISCHVWSSALGFRCAKETLSATEATFKADCIILQRQKVQAETALSDRVCVCLYSICHSN